MWIVYSVLALLSLIIWVLISPMLSSIIEGVLGDSTNQFGGFTNFLIRLIIWAGLFFGLYKISNSIKGVGTT